jgi:4-hydroxy-tetrahydrodipicolinate synthase
MTGLFAAVATPVDGSGVLDLATLDRLVDFLASAGVDGICVGGATGEYPHFETAERAEVIRRAANRLPRGRALLVGIGAPLPRRVIELGETAMSCGARALLLSMPMFFRYRQDDLQGYCRDVSRRLRAPCLLYDLPEFTNGLAADTVLTLLREEEFVVGIKDSSGREDNLSKLAAERGNHNWSLLVGDDRLLHRALDAGWDGAISGVAGFFPELLVALCRSFDQLRLDEATRLQRLLDELIGRIAVFPVPWGIRIGLTARGIGTGPLPLPLSQERQDQVLEFTQWFIPWLGRTGLQLTNP